MVHLLFKGIFLYASLGLMLGVTSCDQTILSGGPLDGGMSYNVGICTSTCSDDRRSVVDCRGVVQRACGLSEGCADARCIPSPCEAARISKNSYGCDYWALKTAQRLQVDGACFAALIANSWPQPVRIRIDERAIDFAFSIRLPSKCQGRNLEPPAQCRLFAI